MSTGYELLQQLIDDYRQNINCNISPKLRMGFNHIIHAFNFRNIKHFLFILSKESQPYPPFILSFINSDFYQCYRQLLLLIECDDSYFEKLLENILKEHQLDLKIELLERYPHLLKEHAIQVFTLQRPVGFSQLLECLDKFKIIDKIPLQSLFEKVRDPIFLEGFQKILNQLDSQNAFDWANLILLHPNPIPSLTLFIKFRPTSKMEELSFLFATNQIENIKIISMICSYLPYLESRWIQSLLEKQDLQEILNILVSLHQQTALLMQLFTNIDKIKKRHFQALNLLHTHHFLNDENIEWILNYQKPISIYYITESMMRFKDSLNPHDFIRYFAYFENRQAIKELKYKLSNEKIAQLAPNIQKHIENISKESISYRHILNFGFDLLPIKNHLPKEFNVFFQSHFMQCLKYLAPYQRTNDEWLEDLLSQTPSPNIHLPIYLKQIENLSNEYDFPMILDLRNSIIFPQVLQSIAEHSLKELHIELLFSMHLADMLTPQTLDTLISFATSSDRFAMQKQIFLTYEKNQSQISMGAFLFLVNLNCSPLIEFKKNPHEPFHQRKRFLNALHHHPDLSQMIDIFQMLQHDILIHDLDYYCHPRIASCKNIPILHTILQNISVKEYGELLFILEYPLPQFMLTATKFDFKALILSCRIKELEFSYDKSIENDTLDQFVLVNECQQPSHLLNWIDFCKKYNFIQAEHISKILSVYSCEDTLYAFEKITQTSLFQNTPLLCLNAIINSQYPLIVSELLKIFDPYPQIFHFENLIMWSHHPHLKSFYDLAQLSRNIKNPKIKEAFLKIIATLDFQADVSLLFKILNHPNLDLDFNELDVFLEKLTLHPHLHLILELTEKGILKNSFLSNHQISLLLEILDSKHFEDLSSILCTLSVYKCQIPIQQFINYREIKKIAKLLPLILDAHPKFQLNEIIPHRLDHMIDFVEHYQTLSVELIRQVNKSIFDYEYTKRVINKLIFSGYLAEDDHDTHCQIYLKINQVYFERLIHQWDELNIFNANEKIEVLKHVANHPHANEIESIFFDPESIYSKELYMLFIHSETPYEAYYLCQLLHCAKLLPYIKLSLLEYFFKYPTNLTTIGQHLSLFMENYKKLEKKVGLGLLYYVFNARSPKEFKKTFEKFSEFQTPISINLMFEFISHVDQNNQLTTLQSFLDILLSHQVSSLKFFSTLNHQSRDTILHLLDCFELLTEKQMISHDNLTALLNSDEIKYRALYLLHVSKIIPLNQTLFETILQEEQPREISRFIEISIQLNIFSLELFNALMTNKTILFGSPMVCERFLSIASSQFLSFNLYQLLKIAQRYQDDLEQASEALLIYCSNLSLALNDSQITHTKSVHQSSSESAKRLWARYHEKITHIRSIYESFISLLHEYMSATDLLIAKKCIQKIYSTPFGNVVDPVSEVSVKNLLALCIKAIQDDSCLVYHTPMANRIAAIHRGLSDIEIGTPEDNGDPICPSGAFNKLIEIMTGIHVDCEQVLITQQMAGAKLIRLMIHHTRLYLTETDSPFSQLKAQEKLVILEKLLQEGIHVICDDIIPIFADEFIEEYKSIFKSKEHHMWETFIQSAQYIDTSELNPMITNLKESLMPK